MAGKGDTPRPVDFKKYQENYEFIFGNKEDNFFSIGDIIENGCINEGSNIPTPKEES